MLDRFERAIKISCLGLGVLLGCRMLGAILSINSLSGLTIPSLPTLAAATNEAPKSDVPEEPSTNETPGKKATKGTNAVKAAGTKSIAGTNTVAGTNVPTNGVTAVNANSPIANETAQATASASRKIGRGSRAGGPLGMFMSGGPSSVQLPPEAQARVDRIVESQVFGTLIHTPLALLGIAGDQAFIRVTNGMSGPVAIGGDMAGVKLLRIGINRVLVDDGGEKKELTLFDGVGGENLMPKETNKPSTSAARSSGNLSTNTLLSSKK